VQWLLKAITSRDGHLSQKVKLLVFEKQLLMLMIAMLKLFDRRTPGVKIRRTEGPRGLNLL